MNVYTATPPANADIRDVVETVNNNSPVAPLAITMTDQGTVWISYSGSLTAQQISTLQSAVAGTTPDPNAPWAIQANLLQKAAAALSANTNYINNIAPTATAAQVGAQVLALTKQMDAIGQIVANAFSNSVGT